MQSGGGVKRADNRGDSGDSGVESDLKSSRGGGGKEIGGGGSREGREGPTSTAAATMAGVSAIPMGTTAKMPSRGAAAAAAEES
jgi:hypothetical protein